MKSLLIAPRPRIAEKHHECLRVVPPAGSRSPWTREHSTIRVGRGVRLDLGATAKALAADRAAQAAYEATGAGSWSAAGEISRSRVRHPLVVGACS